MDGLGKAIGGNFIVQLDRDYLAGPLTLRDLGTIENFLIVSQGTKLDQFQQAAAGMPEDAGEFAKLLDNEDRQKQWRPEIGVDETMAYIDGREGIEMTAWLCLRKYNDVPRAFITRLLKTHKAHKRFRDARNVASGMDESSVREWQRFGTGGVTSKYIPWRKIVVEMCDGFGWSIRDVGDLTLYQLRMFTAKREHLGGLSRHRLARALG